MSLVHIRKRLGAVILCCVLVNFTTSAQPLTTIPNENIRTGARAIALADAYEAEGQDASVLSWNPAALSFLHRMDIVMSHGWEERQNVFTNVIAVPVRIDRNQVLAVGGMLGRARSVGPLEYSWDEYRFDLATARRMTHTFSVGIRGSFHIVQTGNARIRSGIGSVGLYYAPEPRISYAFVYDGIRLGSFSSGDGETGVAPLHEPKRSFSVGVAMRYPSSRHDRFMTLSLANEKEIGQRGLRYKGGIELLPWSFLALRGGYLAGPFESELRFGAGVLTPYLSVSYAYAPRGPMGRMHHVSVLFSFWE